MLKNKPTLMIYKSTLFCSISFFYKRARGAPGRKKRPDARDDLPKCPPKKTTPLRYAGYGLELSKVRSPGREVWGLRRCLLRRRNQRSRIFCPTFGTFCKTEDANLDRADSLPLKKINSSEHIMFRDTQTAARAKKH